MLRAVFAFTPISSRARPSGFALASFEAQSNPLFGGFFCVFRVFRTSDRGGTRTLDQRINLPHRLSPTATTQSETISNVSHRNLALKVWTIPSPSQACRV